MNIFYLPVEKIVPEENRFKSLDDELFEKLVESIKSYGILEPLIVSRGKEDGLYVLIQGHQRYAAAKQLGLKEIPCKMIEDKDVVGARYDVNLYRRHLDEREIEEYEQKKVIEEQEFKSTLALQLIPELNHIKDILPFEILKILATRFPPEMQKKF